MNQFPSQEGLNILPSYIGLKLKAINIKQFYNDGPLTGIQMIYSDNTVSPMFETQHSKNRAWKVRTILVESKNKIRGVSINVD